MNDAPKAWKLALLRRLVQPCISLHVVEELICRSIGSEHIHRRLRRGAVLQLMVRKGLRGHHWYNETEEEMLRYASTMIFLPGDTLRTDLVTTIRYGMTLLAVPVVV